MDEPILDTSMQVTGLHIGSDEASFLKQTAVWSKFLAIVGFVMCGVIVIVALFFTQIFSMYGTTDTPFPAAAGIFVTIIYLLVGVLYFFPCYYLFNFANKLKGALLHNDQELLRESLRNQKSCYKFFGIMTLVFLCFYGIALIGVMVAGIASKI